MGVTAGGYSIAVDLYNITSDHGLLRSSVRRAYILLRHLLGTWPSSRGVSEVIAV
jgi:hypothetical protein